MIDDRNQHILVNLFRAYYTARRHKRMTHNALVFEIEYESQLIQLYHDLISGHYTISKSICFLVKDPVKREIFAADFRDRIVHHLIYNYLYRSYDQYFIYDSYSCRVGKGTHRGVQRIQYFIRSCSRNYMKDCYILKLDIQGFFMSIDKHILFQSIESFITNNKRNFAIDKSFLTALLRQIIFHDPTKYYDFKGDHTDYSDLPANKSLFSSSQDVGLPIGNLTSQLFANVYLDPLDKYIKYTLGCEYYGRYVDDFVLVHSSKEYLLQSLTQIRRFLTDKLHLTLHPKKIYLQHYSRGVIFLGTHIKPYASYLNRRTITKRKIKIRQYNKGYMTEEKFFASLNAYLGFAKHHKCYTLSRKMRGTIDGRFKTLYTLDKYVCRKIEEEKGE